MPDRDGDSSGAADRPAPPAPDPRAIPQLPDAQGGRARELTRRRTRRAALPDTGRRHHIGAAPTALTVLHEDGSYDVTRTAPIQLADQTNTQLARLAAKIESEMRQAAIALNFERAAHLRQEAANARSELRRRTQGPPTQP